jgi:hypothetical protein
MARLSTDVYATSNCRPCSRQSAPALAASSMPSGLKGTSVQPVKRFSWFQTLCACRKMTSRFMDSPVSGSMA